MTHRPTVDEIGGNADARVQLKPDPPVSTHLDGAWWPRSTQLTSELPVLVEALSEKLGTVAVVGYHSAAWSPTPQQMPIAGNNVLLQAFTSDEPATVILIGHDSRRITLQVIAPDTTEMAAHRELDAGSAGVGPTTNHEDQLIARSVAEVAAELARHEGRADPHRTAQIARWCHESAEQFVDAPVQTFVPILVHHIVRTRMSVT